jgi:hypothetical protein
MTSELYNLYSQYTRFQTNSQFITAATINTKDNSPIEAMKTAEVEAYLHSFNGVR